MFRVWGSGFRASACLRFRVEGSASRDFRIKGLGLGDVWGSGCRV